jgi:hypothetical protein
MTEGRVGGSTELRRLGGDGRVPNNPKLPLLAKTASRSGRNGEAMCHFARKGGRPGLKRGDVVSSFHIHRGRARAAPRPDTAISSGSDRSRFGPSFRARLVSKRTAIRPSDD